MVVSGRWLDTCVLILLLNVNKLLVSWWHSWLLETPWRSSIWNQFCYFLKRYVLFFETSRFSAWQQWQNFLDSATGNEMHWFFHNSFFALMQRFSRLNKWYLSSIYDLVVKHYFPFHRPLRKYCLTSRICLTISFGFLWKFMIIFCLSDAKLLAKECFFAWLDRRTFSGHANLRFFMNIVCLLCQSI